MLAGTSLGMTVFSIIWPYIPVPLVVLLMQTVWMGSSTRNDFRKKLPSTQKWYR
jgi:hypothetical protein